MEGIPPARHRICQFFSRAAFSILLVLPLVFGFNFQKAHTHEQTYTRAHIVKIEYVSVKQNKTKKKQIQNKIKQNKYK